eukprot:CAMPEP_0174981726 /NCGR_PEP_ID=MMETSP0004_2-20121128/16059_1 /TAXON_ID=420556 /ORGANISM="Ochromonas sp., Strain CCMP1393" /LENGTH=272 /DNA_ID=CAMNT_0016233521 /DNA_START=76 /DNA_END=894 /DNA_ORIENTATION=-
MTSKDEPFFDADMSAVYNKIADNHRHKDGPWPAMANQVESFIKGGIILDIASGPGEPAATIAKVLPAAKVYATDFSPDMVAAARLAHADIPNMTIQQADAQDLKEFSDNSVDVVTCCYGYMFPPDKEKALAETYRVLKPGGLLVTTTWDSLDFLKLAKDVMTVVLGFTPPPPPLNPMSLSEPGLFETLVKGAGFVDVVQTTSTYPFDLGTDKEFQFRSATLLMKEKIDELGDEAWIKARAGFDSNIDKYSVTKEDGSLVVPNNTFRLTVAKK